MLRCRELTGLCHSTVREPSPIERMENDKSLPRHRCGVDKVQRAFRAAFGQACIGN